MKVLVQVSKMAVLASVGAMAVSLHASEEAQVKTEAATKKSAAVAAHKAAKGAREEAVLANSTGPLSEAYRLLASADHDYNGHRALAMREVKNAARLVGQRVTGERSSVERVSSNRTEPEAQAASDGQLRRAQSLLQGAAGSFSGEALQHVQAAVQHLSLALNVR